MEIPVHVQSRPEFGLTWGNFWRRLDVVCLAQHGIQGKHESSTTVDGLSRHQDRLKVLFGPWKPLQVVWNLCGNDQLLLLGQSNAQHHPHLGRLDPSRTSRFCSSKEVSDPHDRKQMPA